MLNKLADFIVMCVNEKSNKKMWRLIKWFQMRSQWYRASQMTRVIHCNWTTRVLIYLFRSFKSFFLCKFKFIFNEQNILSQTQQKLVSLIIIIYVKIGCTFVSYISTSHFVIHDFLSTVQDNFFFNVFFLKFFLICSNYCLRSILFTSQIFMHI